MKPGDEVRFPKDDRRYPNRSGPVQAVEHNKHGDYVGVDIGVGHIVWRWAKELVMIREAPSDPA